MLKKKFFNHTFTRLQWVIKLVSGRTNNWRSKHKALVSALARIRPLYVNTNRSWSWTYVWFLQTFINICWIIQIGKLIFFLLKKIKKKIKRKIIHQRQTNIKYTFHNYDATAINPNILIDSTFTCLNDCMCFPSQITNKMTRHN